MLEVKNIHKKFGSNEVLKGVDFKVEKGSVIAVLGASPYVNNSYFISFTTEERLLSFFIIPCYQLPNFYIRM